MDFLKWLNEKGIEIPDEHSETFDKEFRKNYKHITEVEGKTKQIETLTGQLNELQETVKKFDGVDVDKLKSDLVTMEETHKTQLADTVKNMSLEFALKEKGAISHKAALAELNHELIKDGDIVPAITELYERIPALFQQQQAQTQQAFTGVKPSDGQKQTLNNDPFLDGFDG